MLTSKEILERARISRATLNNYISWGLLPRPEVRRPDAGSSRARRLGYFPDSVLDTIHEVERLKKTGLRMDVIVESLQLLSVPASPPTPPVSSLPASPALPTDATLGAAVLAGRLVDEERFAAELPPDEFAELTAEFFSASTVVPNDEMSVLAAVRDIEEAVLRLDDDWRHRKDWLNRLQTCLVLDGSQSSNQGSAHTIATLLNRPGVWATKGFLTGIGAEILEKIVYGVEWPVPTGHHRVLKSYARLQDLVETPVPWPAPYGDFEAVPVAQIFELM